MTVSSHYVFFSSGISPSPRVRCQVLPCFPKHFVRDGSWKTHWCNGKKYFLWHFSYPLLSDKIILNELTDSFTIRLHQICTQMSFQLFADSQLENIAVSRNKPFTQTTCGVLGLFTYQIIYLFILKDALIGFLTIPCALFLLSCFIQNSRKNKQDRGRNEVYMRHSVPFF